MANCLVLAMAVSCGPDRPDPVVKPEINIRHLDLVLSAGDEPYELDVDSNGTTDYRLLVYVENTPNREKAIFRVEGRINDLLTTVIHGNLIELTEEQQCDITYLSVLEARLLQPGSTVGDNLNYDWWMIGDFHHNENCFGGGCTCPGTESDIEYIPLSEGASGYIGLRFVRYRRLHYAWLEVRRMATAEPTYIVERLAWRRSPETALVIEN